jgi:hypothetical protein
MDLDTLIYIIVMIVFFVIGAIGKRKKPVQHPLAQQEEEEDIFTSEDIVAKKLREFLGGYDEKEAEDYEGAPAPYHPEPVHSKKLEEYEEMHIDYKPVEAALDEIHTKEGRVEEGVSVFEHYDANEDDALSIGDLTKQDDPHGDQNASNELFAEISSGFDARKAILYSEIINRKEF